MPERTNRYGAVTSTPLPKKVLLTGGREVGGLSSFAEALAEGFQQLGIPCEIIAPARIWTRWREMRDRTVLKILSTTAVFAAPFVRRAVCVTHGFPTAGVIGRKKFIGHVLADYLANVSRDAPLATVSEYSALHLRAILGLRIDAVVSNPLRNVFLEPFQPTAHGSRVLITFAGRLHPSKNLRRLLPALFELLEENPRLQACIIGEGPERGALESFVAGHPRVAFTGPLGALELRERLRRTHVFFSGCPTEALGITYLEALSQGCNVLMPACGGGLEIAPELIGHQVHLMPLTFHTAEVTAAFRRALTAEGRPFNVEAWSPRAIACSYLRAGGWFQCTEANVERAGLVPHLPC